MRNMLWTLVLATLLSGCDVFEDNDDPLPAPPPSGGGQPPPEQPPPTESVDFTDFVIDLVQNNTADNTDPVEINDTEFEFADDDDPGAFDELFDGAP
ncbi:hypothetical protein BH24PSE2_BH24PSE2_22690 [soil metagenome]